MSINETAYDTTACSGSRYNNIIEELQTGWHMGGLSNIEVKLDPHTDPFNMLLLHGGNAAADSIAFFKHPVFVPSKLNTVSEHGKVNKEICVDVRNFGKWDSLQSKFTVRNHAEYGWTIKRAILNKVWADGRVMALRDISTIPAAVYCALISESIARRFALDKAEQMTIAVLAGYFYYSHFTDEAFPEDDLVRIIGNIARITHIPADKVESIIKDLPIINSVQFLCDCIIAKVDSIALQNLNPGVLYAIACGNWFGSDAREILAVGLEHIPTWLMIVHASLASSTYKRSTLSKISIRYDKGGAGTNFTRSIDELIGGRYAINDPEYSNFY